MPDHTPAGAPSWSQLYASRRAAAARLGPLFQLPLAKRPQEILLACLSPGGSVLDVGAGERRLQKLLAPRQAEYFSLDPDPHLPQDYRSLDEVQRTFDCVVAFEVAEHLPFEEILPWLRRLAERVRPGGWLLLSTPNTYYPPAWLRDATHRTPLCYDELAGLVDLAGLQTTAVYRIYNDAIHRYVLQRFIFGWLFRLIGIDYARQIVVAGRKGGG